MKPSTTMFASQALLLFSAIAGAQNVPAKEMMLNIDALPIVEALHGWARQTGMQLVVMAPDELKGSQLVAPAVKGSFTSQAALEYLLSGTQLTYEIVNDRTVVIRRQSKPLTRAHSRVEPREDQKLMRLAMVQDSGAKQSFGGGESSEKQRYTEEVIVTAQKRSENIQDVPVSISAVSAGQLRAADATQLSDVAAAIPGLQLNSQTGQPGSVNITLRGITTADITSTTTAIVVDDVPVGSSSAYAYAALSGVDLLPYDLDHVEVLKGPQGTLYGASSLGGLVKYVTTTPKLDEFSARVGGSAAGVSGSGDTAASGRGFINMPVIPQELAISVGAGHAYRPGYIDNIATGERDFNDGEQDNARVALLWQPREEFRAKLTGLYNSSDFNGLGAVAYDVVTNQPVYGHTRTSFNKPFRDRRQTSLFIGDLSYDFGAVTLTSVTGYSDMEGTVTYDASEIPFYKTTFQANGILNPGEFNSHIKRLSQEFRLSSDEGQQLQWLVGAFYNRERTRYVEHIDAVFTADDQPAPEFTPFYDNDSPSRFEEKAVFANLTYQITDAWDVGGGTRYSRNDQSVSADTTGWLVGGGGASPTFHSSDHSTTWAINSRYRFNPSAMLYGRVATGYRPGGANTAAGVPPIYKPDKTVSYELGLKSDLFYDLLHLNVTAFYIDWTDIQLTERLPNQIPFTGNAGKARSQGVELSSSYRITQELKFGLSAAYTDAKLETDAVAVGARAGDRLPNTPEWSVLASMDWSHSLSNEYTANAGLAWRYVTSRESAFPFAQGGAAHLAAYDAADLTAGLATDRWTANLFVKNLTNEEAFLSYSNFGATILQPRTLGVSMDWNF